MTKDAPPHIFKLRRLPDYSDEAILTELQRVAAAIPDSVLTGKVIQHNASVGLNTIRRRFGTLYDALQRAGLSHRSSEEVKTRGGHAADKMTNDMILATLRELATRLGKAELTTTDVDENLPFSKAILSKRWGTSRAAFEAAGLRVSQLGRRYTDKECYSNLLTVWTHYGRAPFHREMNLPPSRVGGKAYVSRFGTWNKALAAFVQWVDTDEQVPSTASSPVGTAEVGEKPASGSAREYGRDIPLGLRFRVLRRDFFKCVLCGDNPPRNVGCILHVDHILPWSKGGKTVEENLRTLCANCNVGRGNRYDD